MTPESRDYDSSLWEVSPAEIRLMDRKFQQILKEAQSWKPFPPKKRETRYDRALLGRLAEAVYARDNPTADHVSRRLPQSPYDFMDADGSRVDVKARSLSDRGRDEWRWTFFRSGGTEVDFYHFYGLDRHCKEILAVFRVPFSDMPPTGFSVKPEGESKWNRYRLPSAPLILDVPQDVETLLEITHLTRETYAAFSTGEKALLKERIIAFYMNTGFPYLPIPSDADLREECEDIQRAAPPVGGVFPVLRGGTRALSAYMPHRYEARNINAVSALQAFRDEQRLSRAVEFCLKHGKPDVSPDALRGALTALNRTPGHFSPKLAYAIVKRYCHPGGVVLDPCAGWGGRLVGTLLADCSYVGVEPEPRTHAALHRVGERLRNLGGTQPPILLQGGIQEVDLGTVRADFAMTSPPFWNQEVYGDADLGSLAEWIAGFLDPMFKQVGSILKPGARFVVHACDFGDVSFPEIVMQSASLSGFVLEETLWIKKSSFGARQKRNRQDPLFVWSRPSDDRSLI